MLQLFIQIIEKLSKFQGIIPKFERMTPGMVSRLFHITMISANGKEIPQ